jgi:tetratricopeptide (TPR) repeat protein
MNKVLLVLISFTVTSCSLKYTDRLAGKGHNMECILKYKRAMRIYNRAIFFNKESVLVYWRRGSLHSKPNTNDNYRKAISDLSKAIKIEPSFNVGYPYWNRALCKMELGDAEGALADFDSAIVYGPEQQNFYFFRAGVKYYHLRDTAGALKDLETAIKLWDDYFLARELRAEIKVELKDYNAAMADYNFLQGREREDDKWYAGFFYHRGIAKYHTSDTTGGCYDLGVSTRLGNEKAKNKLQQLCK